jgi:hypothetical protein
LIGEMGVPTWFNWGMGKDTSTASTSASEPFSIHTSNLALLELVRNPQCNHFKFQAEVRHERSMEILGEVGLYVAHQRYDSQQGPVHYFVPLSFNGIKDEGKRPQALPANVRWMRTMNVVSLQPRLFWEETRWSEWEYRLSGPGLELFQATEALGARPSWRILTLQVTPEGVQGFWGETAIGRLSARELSSEVRQSLETRRQEHPEELRFVGFEPDFFPHGSLGLYVKRGSASFRRVAIEPLGLSD